MEWRRPTTGRGLVVACLAVTPSRTVVSVRVTSAGADGFVLDWVPGETVVDNQQLAQNPVFMAAVDAVRDLRFRLTLNADGELTGLANEDEILPKLKSMMDTIVQQLSERIPADQRTAMVSFMNQVLSPEVLISSATREAEIYFGLNGISMAPGEVAEIALQQPSPFGGGVIPGIFRVRMESVTTDSASLTTETTYMTVQRCCVLLNRWSSRQENRSLRANSPRSRRLT